MKPTYIRTRIDTTTLNDSKLEKELCTIREIKIIQKAGSPSRKYADEIGRAGFQTDTVYRLKILRPQGQIGEVMLRVNPDLQLVMAHYEGVEEAKDLAGRKVYLILKGNSIEGIRPHH